jgi:ubiquinone/menaquinone biosynthesis C-methylase UbiE
MDVATGTGQVLLSIGEAFSKKVIGTDISDNMINVAKQKAH